MAYTSTSRQYAFTTKRKKKTQEEAFAPTIYFLTARHKPSDSIPSGRLTRL